MKSLLDSRGHSFISETGVVDVSTAKSVKRVGTNAHMGVRPEEYLVVAQGIISLLTSSGDDIQLLFATPGFSGSLFFGVFHVSPVSP